LKTQTDLISGIKHFQRNIIIWSKLRTLSKNTNEKTIFPAILYGCETWSLTLLEEYRLRVCGNKVLKNMYGPRGTLHHGSGADSIDRGALRYKLYTKYHSSYQVEKKEMSEHAACTGKRRGGYRDLVRNL
jgi:hypothetical protein